MALPAPLLDAIADFEGEAAKSLSSQKEQESTGTARWMAAVETIRAAAPELKKVSDHLRQALEKLESEAIALGAEYPNLDEVIDFLEEKERQIKETLDAEILYAK